MCQSPRLPSIRGSSGSCTGSRSRRRRTASSWGRSPPSPASSPCSAARVAHIGREHEDQKALGFAIRKERVHEAPVRLVGRGEVGRLSVDIAVGKRTVPVGAVEPLEEGQIAVAVAWRVVAAGVVVDDVKLDRAVAARCRIVDEGLVVGDRQRRYEPRGAAHDGERRAVLVHQITLVRAVLDGKRGRRADRSRPQQGRQECESNTYPHSMARPRISCLDHVVLVHAKELLGRSG